MTLPVVAVVYDEVAAGPAEIVTAARGLCSPVLVVDEANSAVRQFLPALTRRCRVSVVDLGSAASRARFVRDLAPDAVTTFSERAVETTTGLACAAGREFPPRPPSASRPFSNRDRPYRS